MALRKPLTIAAGQIERLQSDDRISIGSDRAAELESLTNNNAGSIVIGTPVYIDGAGTVDKAQADAVGTALVHGLVYDTSISAAAAGNILTGGVLEATTGEWDAVAGTSGGLTAGAEYFLDPDTAGMLTETASDTDGDVIAPIMVAQSTTKAKLQIKTTILL